MQPHPKTHLGDLADPPAALSPLVLKDQWSHGVVKGHRDQQRDPSN
jgi:hypothetical protein